MKQKPCPSLIRIMSSLDSGLGKRFRSPSSLNVESDPEDDDVGAYSSPYSKRPRASASPFAARSDFSGSQPSPMAFAGPTRYQEEHGYLHDFPLHDFPLLYDYPSSASSNRVRRIPRGHRTSSRYPLVDNSMPYGGRFIDDGELADELRKRSPLDNQHTRKLAFEIYPQRAVTDYLARNLTVETDTFMNRERDQKNFFYDEILTASFRTNNQKYGTEVTDSYSDKHSIGRNNKFVYKIREGPRSTGNRAGPEILLRHLNFTLDCELSPNDVQINEGAYHVQDTVRIIAVIDRFNNGFPTQIQDVLEIHESSHPFLAFYNTVNVGTKQTDRIGVLFDLNVPLEYKMNAEYERAQVDKNSFLFGRSIQKSVSLDLLETVRYGSNHGELQDVQRGLISIFFIARKFFNTGQYSEDELLPTLSEKGVYIGFNLKLLYQNANETNHFVRDPQ